MSASFNSVAASFVKDHPQECAGTSPAELVRQKEARFVELAKQAGGPVHDSAFDGISEMLAELTARDVQVQLLRAVGFACLAQSERLI